VTRLLVVNADDFGLTRAVSRGILRAGKDGVVTSVSVLAVAPAFAETAGELAASGLGAGVHLAAVGEDPPLLPHARIPSLTDEEGRFPLDWKAFLARARRVRPEELEAEFAAQIETARSAGLFLDHLDAHQHLQLLSPVREVVLRLARRFGIGTIRVPGAGRRRPAGLAVRWLARGLARRAGEAGLSSVERSEGFDASGRMSLTAFVRLVERVARSSARSAEIFVHPGEADDPDRGRYRWGYRWGEELAALLDPAARAAIGKSGFRPGTFRELSDVDRRSAG
jgi:predicted glycoside hydrolase/deacetylase ChbG (UPF0249 family)